MCEIMFIKRQAFADVILKAIKFFFLIIILKDEEVEEEEAEDNQISILLII